MNWRYLLCVWKNLRFLLKDEHFLIIWATVSFSGWNLLYELIATQTVIMGDKYVTALFACGSPFWNFYRNFSGSFYNAVFLRLGLLMEALVSGSNFGPNTGYNSWDLSVVFLSPSRQMPEQSLKLEAPTASFLFLIQHLWILQLLCAISVLIASL
jgi:hypothetical protein